MIRILFVSALLVSNLIISQERMNVTDSFSVTDDVNILDTPRFYGSYFSEYNVHNNWFFRMEMQERSHDNLINSKTLIEYPLLIKYRLNNNHSFLLGTKVNVLKINGSIDDVSLFYTFGYQYNITEDFSLEGRVDYNFKKSTTPNIVNPTINSGGDYVLYRVGAKFKF